MSIKTSLDRLPRLIPQASLYGRKRSKPHGISDHDQPRLEASYVGTSHHTEAAKALKACVIEGSAK